LPKTEKRHFLRPSSHSSPSGLNYAAGCKNPATAPIEDIHADR
jgi:hypothetical protein